jgi:hypothetical protein
MALPTFRITHFPVRSDFILRSMSKFVYLGEQQQSSLAVSIRNT